MKTYFYNQSLLPHLSVVPTCFVDLDDAYDAASAHHAAAYATGHLALAENLARRLGDIRLYENLVRKTYAEDGNPFLAALSIGSYLVGYYAAVKSLLDGVAAIVNGIHQLGLAPMNIDLCRTALWTALAGRDPAGHARYAVHQDFFEEVRAWRNYASHVATPLVIVKGPTSARLGKRPDEIRRADVDLHLPASPGFGAGELALTPSAVTWISPTKHLDEWKAPIDDLLVLACTDLAAHLLAKARAPASP